jgi:hypothetical protein
MSDLGPTNDVEPDCYMRGLDVFSVGESSVRATGCDIVGSMVSPVWVSPLFVLQAVDIVGSMVTMWWYQRLMYVESRSMPVRDQSPDTSISPDQNSASGGIISSGISWTC